MDSNRRERWIRLKDGRLKVNYDGAFDPKSFEVVARVLIKDNRGEVVDVSHLDLEVDM